MLDQLSCESLYTTVANILRTLLHSNPPEKLTQAKDVMDDALATVMHVMQTTVMTTIDSTPGALNFSRNMSLN